MNTIRQLAMQWFNPLSSAEKTRLTDNIGCRRCRFAGLEIENIFYNEVIVKWWDNLENKFDVLTKYYPNSSSIFEKGLKEIYLKEHSKEEPKVEVDSWDEAHEEYLNSKITYPTFYDFLQQHYTLTKKQ
jgi:hypothetical protein